MKTLKDMFIENKDYYFILPLTSKYNLYIEGTDKDYCNIIGLLFNVNKIKNISLIELNDNEKEIYHNNISFYCERY